MKIEPSTLEKIAHLARLEIKPGEKEQLLEEMNQIITWVEKLGELDTEGVEPLLSMSGEINKFREDRPKGSMDREEALRNAPARKEQFFEVPKIIDQR